MPGPRKKFPVPSIASRLPLPAKIAAVATGILILAAWFYRRGDSTESPIYRTATIERGSVKSTVSATGTLSAVKTIVVGTQVSGQIAAIYADFNDHVRKGQLLATVDPALQNQAVEEAQAQLERAQATMQQAEGDYSRSKQLYEWKVITASEFSAVQSSYSVHRADVKSAQIALERARQNLAYTRIYAPINGVIVERNVDVGQTVAANFSAPQLYLIANDLLDMQILALVDESDIGAIKVGQPVDFTVQAYPAETFTGTVQQVRLQSKTQDNVVNYTVVVGVKNTTGKLLPGMTATAQFLTGDAENVLVVPNAALRVRMGEVGSEARQGGGRTEGTPTTLTQGAVDVHGDGSSAILWTLDKNGTPTPVRVHAGLSDETHTEVAGPNLAVGMKVVVGVIDADNRMAGDASKNPFQNPRPSGGGGDKGG
jgi:HlyD family secretion protein